MPFRNPLNQLILPEGISIPPPVGQSAIFLDPGPPPVIRLYTGNANEQTPAEIKAHTSGLNPELSLVGPDVNASTWGPGGIDIGMASPVNNESFIEEIAENISFRNSSAAFEFLDLQGIAGFNAPTVEQAIICRFKTSSTSMQTQEVSTNTDVSALTNTAYAAPATSVGFSFRAPPSGSGLLWWRARIQINTTAAVPRIQLNAPRLGTGSTIGAGTAQIIHGVTTPSDELSLEFHNCYANGTTEGQAISAAFVTGLVFNDLYNAQLQARINSAVTANYDMLSQSIGWLPLY